jgi:hypothetical protein
MPFPAGGHAWGSTTSGVISLLPKAMAVSSHKGRYVQSKGVFENIFLDCLVRKKCHYTIKSSSKDRPINRAQNPQ